MFLHTAAFCKCFISRYFNWLLLGWLVSQQVIHTHMAQTFISPIDRQRGIMREKKEKMYSCTHAQHFFVGCASVVFVIVSECMVTPVALSFGSMIPFWMPS